MNGESALGDLRLSRHEKLNVVISFIKRPKEPNRVVPPYSHPRRQATEDAKAIIPIALKNDEKLRHAERKANKKNNDKKNKLHCKRKTPVTSRYTSVMLLYTSLPEGYRSVREGYRKFKT